MPAIGAASLVFVCSSVTASLTEAILRLPRVLLQRLNLVAYLNPLNGRLHVQQESARTGPADQEHASWRRAEGSHVVQILSSQEWTLEVPLWKFWRRSSALLVFRSLIGNL